MIIIGYQGIGKSTLARNSEVDGYIDLESSCFWYNDDDGNRVRHENWAEIYTNIAKHLSRQFNIVFVSSHQVVRDELANDENDFIVVCVPDLKLKDQWIKRLEDRYNSTKLEKDYKALMNAKDRYEENINELIEDAKNNDWHIITITDMHYDLNEMIVYYLSQVSKEMKENE